MDKRVWLFRFKADVTAKGADKAAWYVGWYDADGKRHAESCGPGARGKRLAGQRARRVQSELDTGTHRPARKITWRDFRAEYEAKIVSGMAPRSRPQITAALDHFERLAKPGKIDGIKTQTIDAFASVRRQERGKKPGSIVSPATVNKDLRMVKAALRIAHDWGYLPTVPKVRMLREPVKLPTYVIPEHFGAIYKACESARFPQNEGQHYSPCEWWQALVVEAYMTGMRINEILSIRRDDLDLDGGRLITRAADNKGKRDEVIPLHPVVVEHLRKIVGFHPLVFRWVHAERTLWDEFARLQRLAGIDLPCPEDHQHTASCRVYGFHDFRRAFATVNAPRLKPEALQRLMRHKSYLTTLRYVNLASQLDDAVASMPVPEALRASAGF